MKNITNYILESIGHNHISLVFPNMSSLILYKYELEGQISDGKYENSRPDEHWKWINNVGTIKIGKTPGCYNGENSNLGTKYKNSNTRRYNIKNHRDIKTIITKDSNEYDKFIKTATKLGIDTSGYENKEISIPNKKYNIDDFVKDYTNDNNYSWVFRIYGYGALGKILDNSDINFILKNEMEIRGIIEDLVINYKKDNFNINSEYNNIQNNKNLNSNVKEKFTKEFLNNYINELKNYTEKDLKLDLKKMNFAVNTVIYKNYNN